MFYHLHNFSDWFGSLRLFEYISFRAGGAFFRLLCYIYQRHFTVRFESERNFCALHNFT